VPATPSKCHNCGREEAAGGPIQSIVYDRQVVSVLLAHVKILVRPPPPAPQLPTADELVGRAPIHDEQALRWSTAQLTKHLVALQGRGDPVAPAVQAAPAAALESTSHIGANEDGAASAEMYDDAGLVSGKEDSGSDDGESGTNEDETNSVGEEASSGDSVDGDTDDGGSEVALEGAAEPVEQTSSVQSSPRAASMPSDGPREFDGTVSPMSCSPSRPPSATWSGSSSSSSSAPLTRRRRGMVPDACTALPTCRLRCRSVAVVGRDAWQLEEGVVEEVPARARADEDPVVIDRADPLSTLTLCAIKATADVIGPPSDGVATVLVEIGPIPLQMEDLQLTLPNQWFNDEVVKACIELLRVRHLKFASSVRPKPQYIFFNTFFIDTFVKNGRYSYNAVRRWTKKEFVLEARKSFIPVNITDAH